MNVSDLVSAMGSIAPLEYAEPWDRVGLLLGRTSRDLSGPIVLTIDLTERVVEEAAGLKASAVVAYHPPIWDPLKRLTDELATQRIILRAAEAGLAVYTPHTALDAVPGGICDWLCEGLAGTQGGKIAGDCRALTPHGRRESTQEVKIVTFVPPADLERVRNALATAGAGIIGGYRVCSFAGMGTGSFLGGEGTNPAVGQAGKLELTPEARLEMVCSKAALPLALETLRGFHPYEEPAVDVYELASKPARHFGPGRRLVLDRPATPRELAGRLKQWIGRASVRVADLGHGERLDTPVRVVGVCPGSGAQLSAAARAEGCELYVTGEMGHHEIIAALHGGMSVMLGEHTSTERGYLPRLATMLEQKLPGVRAVVSQADHDPLVIL